MKYRSNMPKLSWFKYKTSCKTKNKDEQRKAKLYKKNYIQINDIIKSLNGINPKSLQTTNQPLYMRYYRSIKAIEKIEKEGSLSLRMIDSIQNEVGNSSRTTVDISNDTAKKSNLSNEDTDMNKKVLFDNENEDNSYINVQIKNTFQSTNERKAPQDRYVYIELYYTIIQTII